MPIRGLIDLNGEHVSLEDAIAGEGHFDWPLPLTRAIASGFRGENHYGEPGVLSATTLITPPQIKQLTDRHDLYVEPLDSLWATYGTLMHLILEQADDGAMVEKKLVYDFEGQKIGGTIDRFVEADAEGQDWKVTSAYGVKKMIREGVKSAKPEYYYQANIYKYLLFKALGLKAMRWNLVLICRDWNQRSHGDKMLPVEVVPVDLMPIAEIEEFIRERVTLHQAAALCDDAGLPHCSPVETWSGKRCAKYCAAAPVCHQFGNHG